MPPANKPSPNFYNIKRLNLIFAIGSMVFLGIVIWTVVDDSQREWKHYQREFQRMELEKGRGEIEEEKKKIDRDHYMETKKLLQEAEKKARKNHRAIRLARRALIQAQGELQVVTSAYQIENSEYESAKYRFEKAQSHHPEKAQAEQVQMDARGAKVAERTERMKVLNKDIEEKEHALEILLAEEEGTKGKLKAQREHYDRLASKLRKLKPGLANTIRDLPMLDFMAPGLRIHQLVPEGLTDDYNFVKVAKVDRCITCHLAITKAGYEDAPHPFRTHPNLDLYLGTDSPHPKAEYGCTSCHLGNGWGTSFQTAAHSPSSPEQAAEWKEKYHWHFDKHWQWPMLTAAQQEAGCVNCHTGTPEIPAAPTISKARLLFADLGCQGCHATEGFNELRNVGPDLKHIAEKVDKGWLGKWILNPRDFNPDTKMPRFFGLSNAPLDDRQVAVADAIGTYLWESSTPMDTTDIPQRGESARGKKLVEEIGCLGCHALGDSTLSDHGPALTAVGSKLKKPWLQTWLKDPKGVFPETHMPSMRLTDQETADISAYLLGLRDKGFEEISLPESDAGALDAVALEQLSKKFTLADAQAHLAGMDRDARKMYVGKAMIKHYGCFGCHAIPGFEEARKIGTDLTFEGSKPVARLDFGHLDMPHTRADFFRQKLRDPRSFDEGRVVSAAEKLKMPKFHLTDEEIELLTLQLVSLRKNPVPMEHRSLPEGTWGEIVKGNRLVHQLNCRGCHVVDGRGGLIAEGLDPGFAPPSLDGEGRKVKGNWLFTFLKEPSVIRPWFTLRMPTFGLSDEHASQLVRRFQAQDDVTQAFHSLREKPVDMAMWHEGKGIFDTLRCIQCHEAAEASNKSPQDLAPDLALSKDRLREDWIVQWLKDPQVLQAGTRMPTFFYEGQSPLPDVLGGDAGAQIKALTEYVVHFSLPEE